MSEYRTYLRQLRIARGMTQLDLSDTIGLAPSLPNEFIVVRIIHGASGVTIAGPNLP